MKTEKHDDSLLDGFDISLLAALQRDSTATHQQIGAEIHLSASQVSRRVQRLQAAGWVIARAAQVKADLAVIALPNPQVLAVRPRSIGIADLGSHFVISFMDAPMKPANDAMQAWALALKNV